MEIATGGSGRMSSEAILYDRIPATRFDREGVYTESATLPGDGLPLFGGRVGLGGSRCAELVAFANLCGLDFSSKALRRVPEIINGSTEVQISITA